MRKQLSRKMIETSESAWMAIAMLTFFHRLPDGEVEAGILTTDNGFDRASKLLELYKNSLAKKLYLTGAIAGMIGEDVDVHAEMVRAWLVERSVPKADIVVDMKGMHANTQSLEITKLLERDGVKTASLTVSPYFQPRQFLTFLPAMEKVGYKFKLYSQPADDLNWFSIPHEMDCPMYEMIAAEFQRIQSYQIKGDVATMEELVRYLKWRDATC
ncbi:YdcF family protein [Patescibacteria group bacterium]|nr:YdcF family protein [Patescibacteria group bacterium]MBU1921716.1 YdcF family protein [Patescibacteria group bacterium]